MENKHSLRTKVIKRFYGISGEYDEYKEQEVNKIGNNAFIGLWWYFLISNFIACLFAFKYPVQTLWVYIGLNIFVSVFVVSSYIIIASKKRRLNEVDVEQKDLKVMKNKVLKSGILAGIQFGTSMHILNGIIAWISENENFLTHILSPKNILISIAQGIFFGGFMYLIARIRIKKVE